MGIDYYTTEEEADNYLIAATRTKLHMLDLFNLWLLFVLYNSYKFILFLNHKNKK